jgi:hypothetical protein
VGCALDLTHYELILTFSHAINVTHIHSQHISMRVGSTTLSFASLRAVYNKDNM